MTLSLKKKASDTDIVIIAFPSFIRRVGGETAKALKAIASQQKCELKRIRRSRNWQLSGKVEDLDLFAQQLKGHTLIQDYPFFIERVVEGIRPHLQESLPIRLSQLISNYPAITLAELMEKTGCTIAQARLARDEEIL